MNTTSCKFLLNRSTPIRKWFHRSICALGVIVALISVAGCAAYFEIPEKALSIASSEGNTLACGEGIVVKDYTGHKKNKSVYARVENTGSCPMFVFQKINDKTTDQFTVAAGETTFTRYSGKKDFNLYFECEAIDSGPATCTGKLELIPHRKGTQKPKTYELRSGDAVTRPMVCADQQRKLPITLRNKRKKSILLVVEVTNTGQLGNTCPIFKLNVTGGKPTAPTKDTNGQVGITKKYSLGKDKVMTFSVQCEGAAQPRSNCDGDVKIFVGN